MNHSISWYGSYFQAYIHVCLVLLGKHRNTSHCYLFFNKIYSASIWASEFLKLDWLKDLSAPDIVTNDVARAWLFTQTFCFVVELSLIALKLIFPRAHAGEIHVVTRHVIFLEDSASLYASRSENVRQSSLAGTALDCTGT